ncbi:MAG: hypothetical protein K8R69_06815, partial [Deltaproteobacteria bacterium]|nr:hypothetical protein [Deltaproteobacteria bacterium]
LFRFENRMDELSANIRELPEKKREIATEELKALQELKNSRILPRITLPMVKEIAEICRTGDNEDYSEYFPISLNLLHDLSEGHPDAEVRRLATSTLQKKLSETGDVDWDLDSNDEMEFAEPSYEQRLQTFQDSLETLKTSPLDIPALRRLQMQRMLLERYLEGLSKREKANAVKKLDELDRRTVSEVFSWICGSSTNSCTSPAFQESSSPSTRLSPQPTWLKWNYSSLSSWNA